VIGKKHKKTQQSATKTDRGGQALLFVGQQHGNFEAGRMRPQRVEQQAQEREGGKTRIVGDNEGAAIKAMMTKWPRSGRTLSQWQA
jgi:hypothetical protein